MKRFFSYEFLGILIQLLVSVIMARLLYPESFGLVAQVLVVTGFLAILPYSGFNYIIMRSKKTKRLAIVMSALMMRISLYTTILIIVIAYPISLFYSDDRLILLTLFMAVFNFIVINTIAPEAALSRDKKFSSIGKVRIISIACGSATTITLAMLDFTHFSIVVGMILGESVKFYLYNQLLGGYTPHAGYLNSIVGWRKSRYLFRDMFKFSALNYWSKSIDTLLIGKIYDANTLGIYSRAYQLLSLPLRALTSSMNTVIFPILSERKSSNSEYKVFFLDFLSLVSLIPLIVLYLFCFYSEEIIVMLWGQLWIDVATLMPYLGITLYVQILVSLSGNMLILEKSDNKIFFSSLGIVFNLIAIIYAVGISIEAVVQFYALSSIIGMAVFTVYYTYIYVLKYNFKFIALKWMPKIILITTIWLGLILKNNLLLEISFLVLFLNTFQQSWNLITANIKRL
jgi:teichuronic acid exporter